MSADLKNMRVNYTQGELFESAILYDPMLQFEKWLSEAAECPGIGESNAMTLATANRDGVPNARIVLLKGFDANGFVFYTNYGSKKGQELAENPNATLLFYWHPLQRTVRVQGCVAKVSPEESDAYFKTRPFLSRIAAVASNQSEVIPDKECLSAKYTKLLEDYSPDSVVPRPECWGGYRLAPIQIEFWQGGRNRLHDRLVFTRPADGPWPVDKEGWKLQRLSP